LAKSVFTDFIIRQFDDDLLSAIKFLEMYLFLKTAVKSVIPKLDKIFCIFNERIESIDTDLY